MAQILTLPHSPAQVDISVIIPTYKPQDYLWECLDSLAAQTLEPERFERAKRASFGARLRGFEDFDNVCVSLAGAAFDGYDAFAAPAVLSEVTADECAAFIRENLAPERLAISIITPVRN